MATSLSPNGREPARAAIRAAGEDASTGYFQGILQLVDSIYAAACREIPWEKALAEVCRVGEFDGCALSVIDPLAKRRAVAASYGLRCGADSEATPGPIPGNAQLTDRVLRSKAGTVLQDVQIKSDALATSALRRAGDSPDSFVAWACVVVGRDAGQVVCLEAYAGAGHVMRGPELRDLLRQLAPHLARAWRLGRTSPSALAVPACARSPLDAHADAASAPELAGLPEIARLRLEFGLTKAEARLALRLAEGSSLASAAQAFNVKLTTIRSQLQQVFAKTGTCRQTELVARILSRSYGTRSAPSWPARRDRQAAALVEP